MIQKFSIFRDDKNDILIIKEFAVVDSAMRNIDRQDLNDEDFSFVGREEYKSKAMETALSIDKNAVVSSLRTPNLYPIGSYAEAIADSIADLYGSKSDKPIELIFDDQELLRSLKADSTD